MPDLVFRFRNGDESDDLRNGLQAQLSSSDTKQRQSARYHLGRWYHRHADLYADGGSLATARDQYHSYIKSFDSKTTEWHSDTRFYKALTFLDQAADRDLAKMRSLADECLRDMQPSRDRSIFVDHIRWTSDGEFAVFYTFSAEPLRTEFRRSLNEHRDIRSADALREQVRGDLKKWCQYNRPSANAPYKSKK